MWGSIIGGLAGDLIGGLMGSSAQKQANATNIKLQRENQDWMAMMSNTQWQRGVDDMKAAGLNPMLAYSQGGASSPSSSAATVEPVDAMARAANSAGSKAMQAVSLAQGMANLQNTEANTEKTKQETIGIAANSSRAAELVHLKVERERKEIERIIQDFQLTEQQRVQIVEMLPILKEAARMNIDLTAAQTNSAKFEAQLKSLGIPEAEVTAQWFSSMMGGGGRVTNALKDIIQVIQMIRGAK